MLIPLTLLVIFVGLVYSQQRATVEASLGPSSQPESNRPATPDRSNTPRPFAHELEAIGEERQQQERESDPDPDPDPPAPTHSTGDGRTQVMEPKGELGRHSAAEVSLVEVIFA
ncbi:hypothetical protein Hte_012112 [Hypoxylon texense]